MPSWDWEMVEAGRQRRQVAGSRSPVLAAEGDAQKRTGMSTLRPARLPLLRIKDRCTSYRGDYWILITGMSDPPHRCPSAVDEESRYRDEEAVVKKGYSAGADEPTNSE